MVTEQALALPRGRIRRSVDGASFMVQGLWYFVRHPWTWLPGFLPALAAAALVGGLILLGWFLILVDVFLSAGLGMSLVYAWFSNKAVLVVGGGSPVLAALIATLAMICVGSVVSLAGILLFAEVVKLAGQPFWQVMCERLEREAGAAPPAAPPRTARAMRDSLLLFGIWLGLATPLMLFGIVPVIGQTVVPVGEAALAAWFLSAELTQIPLSRRGLAPRERHAWLAAHRAETIGFGLAALALFMIPGMNVIAVPGAVLGGTLLIRELEKNAA